MSDPRSAPVTVPVVRSTKVRDGREPLVMVTAYDAPGARIVDAAGVDMILVGDSVANVVLGYEDTLHVTVDDMAHHVAAVARAREGGGPTLLECTTFRLWGHYFGDAMRYIPAEELEAARRDEPVGRYRATLAADGVLDAEAAAAVDQAARDEVEAAFAAALADDPPDAGAAFTDVYLDAGEAVR